MMNRRRLIGALASGLVAASFAAHSQPAAKIWRIGFLGIAPPGTSPESERLVDAFVQVLGEKGFVSGKNIILERRATGGQADRAAALIAELIRLPTDILVVVGAAHARVAKDATSTIPIVLVLVDDPVANGLIASFARPGGNVTGFADFEDDLYPKRLELLKTVAPKISRVAVVDENLSRLGAARSHAVYKAQDAAAQALGIDLLRVSMSGPMDFNKVTATIVRERADALLFGGSAGFSMRNELAEFATQFHMPSMTVSRSHGSGGALMSLGPDYADIFRRAATYVVKIFNGAKAGELPVERPTKLELMINLKTAKAIGIAVPQSLLLRADEVIE